MNYDTIFHSYYLSSYILPSPYLLYNSTLTNNQTDTHHLISYKHNKLLYRSLNIPKNCYNNLTFDRLYKFNNISSQAKIFDLILHNNLCFSATSIGNIHVLSPITKTPIFTLDNTLVCPNSIDTGSLDNGVNCMRIVNDHSLLTGSEEGSIKLWDLRMRKVLVHNHDHQDGLKNIFHYKYESSTELFLLFIEMIYFYLQLLIIR